MSYLFRCRSNCFFSGVVKYEGIISSFEVKRMVTRGQRRLGRTIRTLENSVELSAKENKARESEKKYKEKLERNFEDSPVQDLRRLANKKKSYINNE
jgi:hypothetical protein